MFAKARAAVVTIRNWNDRGQQCSIRLITNNRNVSLAKNHCDR